MGVDEALLESAAREGLATLRLYTWDGPWLSLGYAQRLSPEQIAACHRSQVGVVRRVTGGRAVLHGSDLTYALAAPEDRLPSGLTESYQLVSQALEAALVELGLKPQRTPPGRAEPEPGVFDCFAAAAAHEICVEGRKLAGSAQRRAAGALLQHGSIRLAPDPERVARVTGLRGLGATSLLECGVAEPADRVGAKLVESFCAVLGAPLREGSLSTAELEIARRRCLHHRSDPLMIPTIPRGRGSRVHLDGR
jgi:lipoate-protein ligase A